MSEEKWEITLSTKNSPLLIGGWSSSAIWDKTTAIENKKPVIPASAIKGALRIEFERLMRGIGENICDISSSEDKEERGCGNCICCILFGGGNKEGKLMFSIGKLKGEDKEKQDEFFPKIGVAISRKTGTGVDKKLYSMLTYKNAAEFTTTIYSSDLSEKERKVFKFFLNYLASTGIYIGGRKGVGYGYFDLKYENDKKNTSQKKLSISIDNLDKWKFYEVTIRFNAPLRVGDSSIRKYLLHTLAYIPANTIRGAIAFALIRMGANDKTVKELFLGNEKYVRVSDFYYKSSEPVFLTEKREKGGGKKFCTLIYSFLLSKMVENGKFNEELYERVFGKKNHPFVPASGDAPASLYNIKLTLNRTTNSAHPERLIGMKLWEEKPGEYFEYKGLIYIPESLSSQLEDIEIYVGGQRSRGYGRGKIKIEKWSSEGSIDEFNEKLKKVAEEFKIKLDNKLYFTIDFLSNAVLPENGIEESFKTRFPSLKIEPGTAISTGWIGGYSEHPQNRREKPLKKVIRHGSVILASVDEDKKDDLKKILEEMKTTGWFDDKEHGIFGFIDICNKNHLKEA